MTSMSLNILLRGVFCITPVILGHMIPSSGRVMITGVNLVLFAILILGFIFICRRVCFRLKTKRGFRLVLVPILYFSSYILIYSFSYWVRCYLGLYLDPYPLIFCVGGGIGLPLPAPSGPSSSSSWTEDSFEMRVLLEPFSETEMEGTSMNPTIPRVAGEEAGPSRPESSSSLKEDSFEIGVLEESSYGTGTSTRESTPVNQPLPAARPVPPENPAPSPGAAQEALPQAPAPAEVPHPAPDQEERAALLGEIRALVVQLLREESERGLGRLSFHFPEMMEGYARAAESIMDHDLEISRETPVGNLREWAEAIRRDPSLLRPLITDFLGKRR